MTLSSTAVANRSQNLHRTCAVGDRVFRFLRLLILLFIVNSGWAEQRFPPPDFQSGYELPTTSMPPARRLWLEYGDAVILFVALGAATYFALRRRSRRGIVTVALLSLLYFGFIRQGCICAIGAIGNVSLAFFNPEYAVPWVAVAFLFLPLIFALFVGRTFCSSVCPHGAIQDLVLVKPIRVPSWVEAGLGMLPFVYLGAAVWFAATASDLIICRFDPFVPIFRLSGGFAMILLGVTFLLVAMFVGRPYCRFLCPLGALLRMGSSVSKWRVRITPDSCTQCRLCEESCPYGAIRKPLAGDPLPVEQQRRRLNAALLTLPVLIAVGAWLGHWVSDAASRVHPAVALAERLDEPESEVAELASTDPERLEWNRAQANRTQVVEDALRAKRRVSIGGWIFGGWVGLVTGVQWIGVLIRRNDPVFEPDSGRCVACARCFESCPEERLRRERLVPEYSIAGAISPPLSARFQQHRLWDRFRPSSTASTGQKSECGSPRCAHEISSAQALSKTGRVAAVDRISAERPSPSMPVKETADEKRASSP